MAYRRCLLIRGKLVDRKFHPSFSYVLHSAERKRECADENPSSADMSYLLHRRSFGSSVNGSTGFAASSHSILMPSSGYSFCRYMSTALNQGSDKIEVMSDVAADVITDSVASQLPVVNEVAIAAADSYLPVKALQYVIDAVHSYTGLNWWAAIVLTTILIRVAALPLVINQQKATSKLTLIRPHMEEIKEQMQDKGMSVIEGQEQMKKLFKEHGVSPFTPLKGLFIQGPIFVSFFLAITNMAEKMQSFKHGGAYWFIDLTTPDNLYIFPVLTALSFLITVECNMLEGMEGNPAAATMKNISRGFAVLTVPLTMGFHKAIFCYWITSNFFSLIYGLVLKVPGVKKTLGVPEIPAAQPTNTSESTFPVFPALKQAMSATNKRSPLQVEPSKLPGKSISSNTSQSLRSVEKQVKRRKKNKKR